MVHITAEGKFNDNSYLIDALLFRIPQDLSIYVIENKESRILIDTGSSFESNIIFRKLKEMNLLPIQKLLLTHSHWDHIQGCEKLQKKLGDFEILASENAIENLKNPGKFNDVYEFKANPVENVTPLKEGDIIDLNGLELEIYNFFGHTQDSIALLDRKNRNIFVGDAIITMKDRETFNPVFMPPDYNESELLKTFQKLRSLKKDLNSISLDHFGIWNDDDLNFILEKMEEVHFKAKKALIEWYGENPDIEYITRKYHETFIPNSTKITKERLGDLMFPISWLIEGLKISGSIK